MPFELKTEFENLEGAIAYLKSDVTTELKRLQAAESDADAEKRRILANRDDVLNEKKTLQQKLTAAEEKFAEAEKKLTKAEAEAAKTKAEAQQGAKEVSTMETKFAEMRTQLEADYNQKIKDYDKKIESIQAEREQEKKQTAEAKLKADAMAELSKPEHNIINPDHFWKLHGGMFRQDDQGKLYVDRPDLGEFKRQEPGQYVQDISQRSNEQYLFKPKGGKGNDSPGAGDNPTSGAPANPWKRETFNLTKQTILMNTNPELAKRLKAEARGA